MGSKWEEFETTIQSSDSSSDSDASPKYKKKKSNIKEKDDCSATTSLSNTSTLSSSLEIASSTGNRSSERRKEIRSKSASSPSSSRNSSYVVKSITREISRKNERPHQQSISANRNHRDIGNHRRHRRSRSADRRSYRGSGSSRRSHRRYSKSPSHAQTSHKRSHSPRHNRKRSISREKSPKPNAKKLSPSPLSHMGIGRNVMAPQYEDDYRKGRRNETHANEIKDRQMIRRELRLEKLVRLSSAPGERNIEVAKQLAAGNSSIDLEAIRKIVMSNDKANPLFTMIMNSIGNLMSDHAPGSKGYIDDIMAKVKHQTDNCKPTELPNFYNPKAVNTAQFAKLEQKKKLLWGKKEKVNNKESKIWGSTEFNADENCSKQDKFRKLMGIHKNNDVQTASYSRNGVTQMKKQDEIFDIQAKNYDNARIATHISRGVGLGFAPQ